MKSRQLFRHIPATQRQLEIGHADGSHRTVADGIDQHDRVSVAGIAPGAGLDVGLAPTFEINKANVFNSIRGAVRAIVGHGGFPLKVPPPPGTVEAAVGGYREAGRRRCPTWVWAVGAGASAA